jgi:Tfp pilus assembly protein PilO
VVRLYETLALTLFTIAFFVTFAIKPTLITISGLIKELEVKKQLTATLDRKIASIFTAQTVYAEAASQLPLLDEALPQTPALAVFSGQVEGLVDLRQVKLKSFSFEQFNLFGESVSEKGGQGGVVSYPFTIGVTGPYSSLYGFLGDLETLRRVVNMDSFGFSQTQTETGSTLTLSISGTVASAQQVK